MTQINLYTKQKQIHRHRKQTYTCHSGQQERGEDKLGIWDQPIHTTIYKINNKDLLNSTGNYAQYLVITYNGKGYEKAHTHTHTRVTLLHLKLTHIVN